MPLIPFPNVPKLPGVPALPRSAKFPPSVRSALGIAQGAVWRMFQVDTRWGVFDSKGKALGDPGRFTGLIGGALESAGIGATLSTSGVGVSKETRVSDFPIERGSFASYNKVEQPASPHVTLCMGGSERDRRTFLEAIDKATKSTDLYSIATPEVTYIGYSIESYNYERHAAKGATLLVVQLCLREIRQVSAQYAQSNRGQVQQPKSAGATPKIDSGKLQAKIPKVSTLKSLANKLPALMDKASSLLQGAAK